MTEVVELPLIECRQTSQEFQVVVLAEQLLLDMFHGFSVHNLLLQAPDLLNPQVIVIDS